MNKWNRRPVNRNNQSCEGKENQGPIINDDRKIIVIPLQPIQGKNITVKEDSVQHVSSFQISECIATMIKENPNVTFYNAIYDEFFGTLSFLSDTDRLNKELWLKRNDTSVKKLERKQEIKDEIARLLVEEKPNDPDMVSIYDIMKLLIEYEGRYKVLEDKYNKELTSLLAKKPIPRFAYKEPEISINEIKGNDSDNQIETYVRWSSPLLDTIVLSEEDTNGDKDYYISKSEDRFGYMSLLNRISDKLPEMFDDFRPYFPFKSQSQYQIGTNSKLFKAGINSNGVAIYHNLDENNWYDHNFEMNGLSKGKYYYDFNSVELMNFLKEHSDELFKSIFVKIDDSPEWMRERLHQIRNEQLEQETGIHKELNKTVQENG